MVSTVRMNIADFVRELPKMELCSKPNARVLLRVDMNVPVRRNGVEILDDYRIEAHVRTLRRLLDMNMAVTLVTHQGRPGDEEFVSLSTHVDRIRQYLGKYVEFVDDVMGPAARSAISRLKPGEALLLDNVRFVSEELLEGEPQKLAETHLVRRLAPLFEYFILDAFATIHRAQPSIVGFPYVLPSCMGLVMEDEVSSLSRVLMSRGIILIAGGAKVPETLRAIRSLLENSLIKLVLVGGLVGQLLVGVKIGNEYLIRNSKAPSSAIDEAKRIMSIAGDRIILPVDFMDADGNVVEASRARDAMDIGPRTLDEFTNRLSSGGVMVMTGPMGVVEVDKYSRGTREVMKSMVDHAEFSVIGGGHTIMSARKFGLIGRVSHVSTGGRAFLQFMSGEELPGLRALALSKSKFWK